MAKEKCDSPMTRQQRKYENDGKSQWENGPPGILEMIANLVVILIILAICAYILLSNEYDGYMVYFASGSIANILAVMLHSHCALLKSRWSRKSNE